MADDKEEPKQPEQTETKITFTDEQQAAINEIISKRLAEKDAKFEKEREETAKRHKRELEMAKLDEDTRRKEEEKERLDGLTKRAEEAERKLRVATAERELAKVGLDPSLAETVMGADDDAMAANIAAITKASKAQADRMYADRVGAAGAPRAPTEGDSGLDLTNRVRAAAGLKPAP